MWKMKTIGLGLIIGLAAVGAIYGSEIVDNLIGFVILAGVSFAGLKWLKNVESRTLHRLIILTWTLAGVSVHSVAIAQQVNMSDLQADLGKGLGIIMFFAVPTGVVMIIKGIIMDRHDGAWKWEILKGLVLAGAPTIINILYNVFGLGAGTLTPSFAN